ncbi:hypothetical protein AKJ08_1279 [Vulgatibacter incomptus]|uniref:Uncharacterized protein n=1 Tax=Vulgatibacter incomptus TaxID=1391653 RepID=A0A0K1PBL7_9BACT|nr:hypothetical protein AKJ08_1279 [Vulgatibacter incomptus]
MSDAKANHADPIPSSRWCRTGRSLAPGTLAPERQAVHSNFAPPHCPCHEV